MMRAAWLGDISWLGGFLFSPDSDEKLSFKTVQNKLCVIGTGFLRDFLQINPA